MCHLLLATCSESFRKDLPQKQESCQFTSGSDFRIMLTLGMQKVKNLKQSVSPLMKPSLE